MKFKNAANVITLLGLMLSLESCFLVLGGNLRLSIIFLIASGICDLFDGVVAGKIDRTDREKEFGIQLDTTVDVVSFGVTPVIILYAAASTESIALVVYIFYIMCTVIRLARFNTTTNVNIRVMYYRGLPVTYIALILPLAMLINSAIFSVVTLLCVGVLYILDVRVPKPRGIWYAIFPALAIILSLLWWFL